MTTPEAIMSLGLFVGIPIIIYLMLIWFAILRVGDKIEKLKKP